jgi:serine/threonine protein phosphatase 1
MLESAGGAAGMVSNLDSASSSSIEAGRLIAIGDVHGCAHALDAVLEAIRPRWSDRIIFLGDLIDQGRDSRDVFERVITLKGHCNVNLIEGNHESMLLAARTSERALRYWENCGGAMTLDSYHFGATLSEIPERHWELLREAHDYVETAEFIFTHANYQSDAPLSEQPEHELRWALFDPATARPHVSGKTVVLGHTEQANSEVLDLGFAVCLDTACWRHGWLTAMEFPSRRVWQASRWGMLREPGESTHRQRLPALKRPGALTGTALAQPSAR